MRIILSSQTNDFSSSGVDSNNVESFSKVGLAREMDFVHADCQTNVFSRRDVGFSVTRLLQRQRVNKGGAYGRV